MILVYDHPSTTKRSGVCFYSKESLAARVVNIFNWMLSFEITIQNKEGYVDFVYRSSQSTSKFESFLSGLEDLLSNILCPESQLSIALGDLNARSLEWWPEEIITIYCTQIDSLTIHGFKQLISDATHILAQSVSYTDFIFTYQSN